MNFAKLGDKEREEIQRRYRHLFQVGDRVVILGCEPYSRFQQYAAKGHPVGAEGVIVGFPIRSVNRFSGAAAGIYQNPERALVRVGNWEVRYVYTNRLLLPDDVFEARIAQERLEHPGLSRASRIGERLCDFPETKFWEGDFVKVSLGGFSRLPQDSATGKELDGRFPDDKNVYMVRDIDFEPLEGGLVESLDYQPRFLLGDRIFFRLGWEHFWEHQLTLVERGNVWRRAHGEATHFRDLAEEVAFALHIGEAREIGPTYGFRERAEGRVAALEKVRAGEADGIRYYEQGDMGRYDEFWMLVTCDDRGLGARLRQATLEADFQAPNPDDPFWR